MPAVLDPDSFRCPISHKIMADPVTAADGMTYEREFIEEWFKKGNSRSPMTGAPLTHLHLNPSQLIKNQIQDQIAKHPEWLDNDEVHLPESQKLALQDAITRGSVAETKKLLDKDKRLLTLPIVDGKSAYHLAMESVSVEVCKSILSRLTSLNLVDAVAAIRPAQHQPVRESAVFRSVLASQCLSECEAMVKLGAKLSEIDPVTGFSLLRFAASEGLAQGCQWLLAKDNSLALKPSKRGDLPLHLAIRSGHDAVVRILLGTEELKKSQLKHQNSEKTIPLAELLLSDGIARRVELLPLFGVADADKNLPILHIALRQIMHPKTEDGLLESILRLPADKLGVLIEQKDLEGRTPLCFAAGSGEPILEEVKGGKEMRWRNVVLSAAVSQLLEAKADPTAKCGPNEENALHAALRKNRSYPASSLLSVKYANPDTVANSVTKDGRTPLHLLVEAVLKLERCDDVMAKFTSIVKDLVAAGAFIDAIDNNGISACDIAKDNGRSDLAALIRKSAFDFTKQQWREQAEKIKRLEKEVNDLKAAAIQAKA